MPGQPADPAPPRTRIGIAVVEHSGQFLVGIRGGQVHLSGKAEFPGGKCDPGESPAECALRECREETGLLVAIDRLICEEEFDYADARVHLFFYLCRLTEPLNGPIEPPSGWQWVGRPQLGQFDFPGANRRVIRLLNGEE